MPEAPTTTAKATVTNPPQLPFTPVAVHIPVKTRAGMIQRVKDYTPEGRPNPVLLKAAKDLVISLIDSLPETATGAEVKFELSAGIACQVMVIVTPHEL